MACDEPWRALTAERVGEVFRQRVRVTRHPSYDRPLVLAEEPPDPGRRA